eukprot:TRINITY_DN5041_c0_g6_i1.p2 TRINITY_DN5041_c0_g6~~TRINITY_DN5041_c0_g6_i1.p2  ORF type:complete len:211 (+),score=93.18 TRINITY_DN5041_c0_g6_i1:47-634(+)
MSVPVPYRPPGHVPPGCKRGAPLTLEFFADMQCPYSKRAWDTVKKVLEKFNGRIQFRFVPYALLGHQQAYDVHRALEVVGQECGPTAYFEFVETLFTHQFEYSNPQFKTRTPVDLLRLLGEWTGAYNISTSALMTKIDEDPIFDAVKAAQRRGISLGIWSTPAFYLNGALLTKVSGADSVPTWCDYLAAFDIDED